jgi:hypothetical protein
MTPIRRLGWTALALFALVGCEPAAPPAATPATPTTPPATPEPKAPTEITPMPVEPGKAEEPKKEGAAVDKPLSDEQLAEIKKLPADEQPIALAQKVCPVSHDALGGEMGVPIKQTIGDKTFYICCAGCEKTVKNKPDEVLAELAKLKK